MSETHTYAREREMIKEQRRSSFDAWEHRAQRQNFLWTVEKMGKKDSGFSDTTKEMLTQLSSEEKGQELQTKPATGEFVFLDDVNEGNAQEPVLCHERQIVRTKRDIVSPAFSSCAGVVLYKVDNEGSPLEETIFAHLPPKVYDDMTGRPADFDDYDQNFFKEKLGIQNLDGYEAKIFAGLKTAPSSIVSSLEGLGARIRSVDQLPRDMYTAMIDKSQKIIATLGKIEQIRRESFEPLSYSTEDGIPITTSQDKGIAIID